MRFSSLLLTFLFVLAGCASVQKTCYADGVCRVERDGVVSWEGPPDKVAARQGVAQSAADAQKRADEAYLAAPKRPASEPVRLALIGPETESPDLAPLAGTYRQMLEQALQGDPRLQLVPYSQVKLFTEARSEGESASMFGKTQPRTAVDAPLARRLRDGAGEVDVVVVAHLSTKKVSGFVGGSGRWRRRGQQRRFELRSSVYQGSATPGEGGAATTWLRRDRQRGQDRLRAGEARPNRPPGGGDAEGWLKPPPRSSRPTFSPLPGDIRQKNTATALQDAPEWMKKLMAK
jgi:hypothetical protein